MWRRALVPLSRRARGAVGAAVGPTTFSAAAAASRPGLIELIKSSWSYVKWDLVGGDWNMTFIFPYIGNSHPN